MKETIVTVTLTIVLTGALTLVASTEFSKAEGTIYIRPDGTINPSTAPIHRDGDIYTFATNISDPIVVQRNNIIVDGNSYTLQGEGGGKGFDLSNRSNVTIRKIYITHFDTGIRLQKSTSNIIENNTITNCVYGVLLDRSPNTEIRSNIVKNNRWDGIFLTASDGSTISNNSVIKHGKWGLYLGYSAGVTLRDNEITGSKWNFGVSVNFIHDIDDSNTVDGKPICYWVNQHNMQVPAEAGYVAIINSTNIKAKNLNLTRNGQGVVLANSENCFIENSIITKMGYYGLQLINSHNNTISANNITDNIDGYFDVGIALQSNSTGNTIMNNLIENNGKGVLFSNSGGNSIYHNNFVNNIVQASSEGSTNIWDDGYPSGGNYWSDYSGDDKKKGSNQNELGGDGIGDRPYIIDDANRDRYPHMSMIQREANSVSINMNPIHVITGMIITAIVALFIYLAIRARKNKAETAP